MALALYIHWPFCLAKCPYCDFNSHVRERTDMAAWAAALLADMHHEAQLTSGRKLTSIFFGGGTPSLMPPQAVGHVLDAIGKLWSVSPEVETTLEANPTSIEAENFQGYRAAGVNRVSVGVQALNDEDLKALGRQHSSEEALAAFDHGKTGFALRADAVIASIGLTPRQKDVLAGLLQGRPNKLIARDLNLSVETVKDHVAAVLRALGVNSRTQAVLAVSRLTQGGLPPLPPPG